MPEDKKKITYSIDDIDDIMGLFIDFNKTVLNSLEDEELSDTEFRKFISDKMEELIVILQFKNALTTET